MALRRETKEWHAAFAAVALLGIALLSSRPCGAQTEASATTTVAPLSESLTADAKAEYDAAKLLVEDGDYVGAVAKFKRAHELSQDPRLLWNMAACEKELRHYANASTLVGRYLSEGGERLTPENRQSATETQAALREFYSELTLSGVPEGGRVLIDGVEVGHAPLSAPLLVDLGSRTLRIERSNYEPYEQALDVPGNAPMTLTVAPKRLVLTSRLFIRSTPANSVIRVDGRVLGTGRWDGTLPAGGHFVQVTAQDRKPYESHIELLARQSRTLDVNLAAEKKGLLWPWIVGGAAVAVGAVVGGYLLFRGEDTPGSAPHGELGTVYLKQVHR